MKVKGLDGKEYKLSLVAQDPANPRRCSKGHKKVRMLLWGLYGFDVVYEEVFVPGCEDKLYVDFFVPRAKLVVEVQGRQHHEYVPHFHGTKHGFLNQLKRDGWKREWAALNGFRLVCLDDAQEPWWAAQLAGG